MLVSELGFEVRVRGQFMVRVRVKVRARGIHSGIVMVMVTLMVNG